RRRGDSNSSDNRMRASRGRRGRPVGQRRVDSKGNRRKVSRGSSRRVNSPPSVGGECALGTDLLEDRQEDLECLGAAVPRFASMLLAPEGDPDAPDIPTPRSYAEAITGPYSSQWQAAMDAKMASWKSIVTYVDAVPPSRANIVDGMWIFGYSFLAGQPARGDLAAPPTWLHCIISCKYPVETSVASLRSPSGTLRVPRNTEDYTCGSRVYSYYRPVAVSMHRYVAATVLRPRVHHPGQSTAHHHPDSVTHGAPEPSGPYPELVGCLMYLMTCTRPDLAYPLSLLACYVAPGRHRKSAAAAALVAELLDFAAACRLYCTIALVAESASASPRSIGVECALGMDVLEDRQEDFECLAAAVPRFASMLIALDGDPDAPDISTLHSYTEAIMGPYSSQWQVAMDAEMASWKSTGTYVDEVPPRGANIVDGMWIFTVKRPPGSPPAFKARYVARGFSQRQGVEYFLTFSPTLKMTTLWVLLHVAAQRDYELHSLDFSKAFLQGSLHEEIWLRHPPGFTESFPACTEWSLRRPVYGLGQAPREWHETLRTTLAALRFAPATTDPSLFLRTDTSLLPFYVLYTPTTSSLPLLTLALTLVKSEPQKRHTCTDLDELRSYLGLQITRDRARHTITWHTITLTESHMVHQSVEPSGPYPELVGCLITSGMGLVLGGQGPVVLTGHADTSWVDDSATQRLSQGYTFILGSGSVSWRSTRSSLVVSSSCKAEIYAGAMAA
ncbi:unnamed protein product, partial [Closterium sp. NIES-53]